MLGFYSALEIITSSAMVCDIWTDVRTGRWDDCIMGHYCDNRKALSSYIIIMAHVGFPSRRFLDMLGVFVWCFLKSLCLTGCLALVDHPCLKSYPFSPLQVSATDEDRGSFGTISYTLSSGTGTAPPTHFTIDKESGQLCTRTTLDRDEGLDKFDLVVTATDGVGSL